MVAGAVGQLLASLPGISSRDSRLGNESRQPMHRGKFNAKTRRSQDAICHPQSSFIAFSVAPSGLGVFALNWLGLQFRTPHAAFRNQRLPGTPQGAWNGGSSQRDAMRIARHFNAGLCPH